jgi:hypothetical protein
MVTAYELALAHQARVISVSDRAVRRALAAWRQMDFENLDASWGVVGPQVSSLVVAAQMSNARSSSGYAGAASTIGPSDPADGLVNPSAFTGVDGSGRDIDGLLHGAVTTTKESVGAGLRSAESLLSGATYLAAMMKTAIHDLSRSSDLTAATSRKYTAYVRVVQSSACSRCAILAGISDSEVAFKRHPACKCTSYPVDKQDVPNGFHATPDDYFASLSREEQDRVFTKSGAEAIRAGASPQSIVSARRGASGISYGRGIGGGTQANSGRRLTRTVIGQRADGSAILGYTTSEGTTVRGSFGRTQSRIGVGSQRVAGNRYSAVKRTRLMPESILPLTKDPELRTVLLRDAGYLDLPYSPSLNRIAAAAEDRAIADEFYRKLGISLG